MTQGTFYEHPRKLSVLENETSIVVQGDTFTYEFDKKSGLINRLEVLGDDFLNGVDSQIPDLYVSDAREPREKFYAAKYEKEAECDVISDSPYEVHIRTHGIYHSPSGESFPIRYRITYEIQNDGVMFVIVDNKAYEPCLIRWLCISRGLLDKSLCRYFSHLADQSRIDTTDNYTFEALASDHTQNEPLFSGRLIPWFWFGNDRTGVEVCTWDVTHHRYGATRMAGRMMDPLGEVGGNISASTSDKGVLWEIFSIRNLQTPVKEGWEQINYFSLSITPPKFHKPGAASLRPYWEGPNHYRSSYKYISDEKIKELSRMGYNLLIGAVNWRSGEYVPDNESEVRRVISTCHKYNIKVIPSVRLMDLNQNTEAFKEHGPEWRIEPVVEYESETNLMCPAASGWREYWMQRVDRIAENYDFDGVYLNFWYDKLACRNPQHGCQRRYMRPTFPWLRDMLKHTRAKFKAHNPSAIVISNTDMLPISMICSWLDLRLLGTSSDVRQMDRLARKGFHNSYRLGCNTLMRRDGERKIDNYIVSISLLYIAPIILSDKQSREEIDLTTKYWNVLRFFGVGESQWYPGFVENPRIKVAATSDPDLYLNIHKRDGLLLTLVNLSSDEIHGSASITNFDELGLDNDRSYLVYEPVAERFFEGREIWSGSDLREFAVTVPGQSPRILYIRDYKAEPVLLYASGSDEVLEEHWDKAAGTLKAQLSTPIGADISLAVYIPAGKPESVSISGKEAQFTWDESQKLVFLDAQTVGATTDVSVKSIGL